MTKEKKSKIELKRVNMNLPSELVQKVVDYAERNGFNTTSAYISLLNQGLAQVEIVKSMPIVLDLLNKVMDGSTLNDEDLKEFEQLPDIKS